MHGSKLNVTTPQRYDFPCPCCSGAGVPIKFIPIIAADADAADTNKLLLTDGGPEDMETSPSDTSKRFPEDQRQEGGEVFSQRSGDAEASSQRQESFEVKSQRPESSEASSNRVEDKGDPQKGMNTFSTIIAIEELEVKTSTGRTVVPRVRGDREDVLFTIPLILEEEGSGLVTTTSQEEATSGGAGAADGKTEAVGGRTEAAGSGAETAGVITEASGVRKEAVGGRTEAVGGRTEAAGSGTEAVIVKAGGVGTEAGDVVKEPTKDYDWAALDEIFETTTGSLQIERILPTSSRQRHMISLMVFQFLKRKPEGNI